MQEYFLVACAIRDIVRQFERTGGSFRDFSSKVAIQMNDTHPALAVCELMRVLVDEKDLAWEEACEVTRATLGYTNHTLAPEALERWPVPLLEHVLPRHLQIIYEINRRFLEEVARARPGDVDRLRRMSLDRGVRAQAGADDQSRDRRQPLGQRRLGDPHATWSRQSLVPDFFELWPERFNNKTNGITQRRWLLGANPGAGAL